MEQDIIYCFETIRSNLIQNRVHQKRLQILDFSLRELDKATEKVKSIKLNSSSRANFITANSERPQRTAGSNREPGTNPSTRARNSHNY